MALSRRSVNRVNGSIWPGFVDAMTALLLVLMFVLTIFMIVQYILRETISGQKHELDALSGQVAELANALGLERSNVANLKGDLGRLNATLDEARTLSKTQSERILQLSAQTNLQARALSEQEAKITSFEAQVATLISQRDKALNEGEVLSASIKELEDAQRRSLTQQDALNLALVKARDEIDLQSEAARLAAAQREALEALVNDLEGKLDETSAALTQKETQRLTEAAAAAALRERLKNADDELTAMTLSLEAQRKEAEDTLTLLAGAKAAGLKLQERLSAAVLEIETQKTELDEKADLGRELQAALVARLQAEQAEDAARAARLQAEEAALLAQTQAQQAARAARLQEEQVEKLKLSASEERARLLALANLTLEQKEAESAESQRKIALLNEQVTALRGQLGTLQSILDDGEKRDDASQVQIQKLGSDLNAALARVAAEQRKRAKLEALERKRLEAEAKELATYRSEFFGKLKQILGNRKEVKIVGDRFVFSSEVLFTSADAALQPEGQKQVANVAALLSEIAGEIPDEVDWIIRVDGHTDNVPLSGAGFFRNNWELSQARALSVVEYMINDLGFPPNRLAATGFGEYRPVNSEDTDEARAQNRRIELKLTER